MDRAGLTGAARAAAAAVPSAWRGAWLAIIGASVALSLVGSPELGIWRLVMMGGAVLLIVEVQAVCYRQALGRWEGRASRRAVMTDAPRLLAVWGLQTVLLLILLALGVLLIGAVALGVASAGKGYSAADPATWQAAMGGAGRAIVGGVGLAVLAGLTWVKARLALSAAATADLGKVQVLSAWPLTKGRVLPVLASMIAAALPSLAVGAALRLLGPVSVSEGLFVGLASGLTACGVTLPLSAGLMTYLYRRPADSTGS